jgi:hypothetical protein
VVVRVAVVALLGTEGLPIPANCAAGESDGGTGKTCLQPARAAATIAADGISVVAGFAGSNPPIATDFSRTDRAPSASDAGIAWLDGARRRATVSSGDIPVIARLTHQVAYDAVSAVLLLLAQLTSDRTHEASLDLAVRRATIPRDCVAVVAFLAGVNHRIRTKNHCNGALAAPGGTGVAWLDGAAVGAATVSTDGIPIITRFTGANDAITANNRRLANLAR